MLPHIPNFLALQGAETLALKRLHIGAPTEYSEFPIIQRLDAHQDPLQSLPISGEEGLYDMAANHTDISSNAASTSHDYFGSDGWKRCPPASLRGHIVNAHLQPGTLAHVGLPLFDVEIAQVRGIGLGWVVKKAVEKLALSDAKLQDTITENKVDDIMTPEEYRLLLVKTISLISERKLAQVPWSSVDRVYQGASSVNIDPDKDKLEMSFRLSEEGQEAMRLWDVRRMKAPLSDRYFTILQNKQAEQDPAYEVKLP